MGIFIHFEVDGDLFKMRWIIYPSENIPENILENILENIEHPTR